MCGQLSSSSDESSCDSGTTLHHWYGRRRAGVKMGVRQRGASHHQRSAHSDPECCSTLSSSEQSCDTVIYVGGGRGGDVSGGRAHHSDREILTDSETTASSVITVQSPQPHQLYSMVSSDMCSLICC